MSSSENPPKILELTAASVVDDTVQVIYASGASLPTTDITDLREPRLEDIEFGPGLNQRYSGSDGPARGHDLDDIWGF